ncbi:MAG: hypothetical protein JSU63_04780 [Phycisphaerales bacterium]|nr:MAG: hypothetical protein JSU63_04780 [Phycisphaerales bacterium]
MNVLTLLAVVSPPSAGAELLLQSPGGLDDWIQFIVIALFIAGSVLGPIAKKLISATTPEKKKEPPKDGGEWIAVDEGLPKARPTVPRPTARPMAPIPRPAVQPNRPLARPVTGDAEIKPVTPPQPLAPTVPTMPEAKPKPTPPQRPRRPIRPPVVRPPATASVKPARKPRKPRKSAKPKQFESSVADQKLESVLGKAEDRAFAERAKELGDLHIKDDSDRAGKAVGGEFASIRNPSHHALRKAIVMSEILGPPLALRKPDDQL